MTDRALTSGENFRSLFAVITAMGVTSALYALTLPLFSTRLDAMGESETVIGINAAAQAIALLAIAPFFVGFLQRLGPAVLMLWMLAATLVFILLCPLYENAWYWLVLRLLLGASTGVMWIAGEAWINQAVDDKSRGRVLSLYGIAGAVGTMVGFALMYLIQYLEMADWTPFVIIAAMVAACMVAIVPAVPVAPPFTGTQSQPMIGLFFVAPTPFLINLLVAVSFGSLASFMSVYGTDIGIPLDDTFLLLILLSAGGLMLYPIGWLADRMDRRKLALIIMLILIVLFAIMGMALRDPVLRWPYAVCLGIGIMGLYTLGLSLLGARFRNADLGAATTVFQIMWNSGVVVGPFAIGFAMDMTGPSGLPWTIIVFFVVVAAITAMRRQHR
ncbi:MAG: MFS transporter [Rhodospirillaceae bacterium]|nr:MFS transporter [Rhodospirillaceae bacterium]MBT6204686.1 MFS transporter [Rhodospirillaceae bacterium]MBT6512917.1 MFS transporter [Rhodospirillaceae bacterium]